MKINSKNGIMLAGFGIITGDLILSVQNGVPVAQYDGSDEQQVIDTEYYKTKDLDEIVRASESSNAPKKRSENKEG